MTWRNKWQENVYVIRYYPIRYYSLLSVAKTYRCYREIILDNRTCSQCWRICIDHTWKQL